ncbi:MAG TPA: nucleoside monophosphate kinase [Verrucomicrobiota bacterium]|nr:nucleoside monophosphate kinase [Verrucomicrobiota bacterium]
MKCDKSAWINGKGYECSFIPKPVGRAYRFVILGAPGVGKGSLAEVLTEKLGVCHIATGDLFRKIQHLPPEQITPEMKSAIKYMLEGQLVPDDIVIKIIRERSQCLKCPSGFVLDGFPRTMPQANALEQMLDENGVKLDVVINLTMPIEAIIERLQARRICSKCGAVYNLINRRPKVEGKCNFCNGDLYQREDDNPEAIRIRMETYLNQTAPLIDYYEKTGQLLTISAAGTPYASYVRFKAAFDKNGEMPD